MNRSQCHSHTHTRTRAHAHTHSSHLLVQHWRDKHTHARTHTRPLWCSSSSRAWAWGLRPNRDSKVEDSAALLDSELYKKQHCSKPHSPICHFVSCSSCMSCSSLTSFCFWEERWEAVNLKPVSGHVASETWPSTEPLCCCSAAVCCWTKRVHVGINLHEWRSGGEASQQRHVLSGEMRWEHSGSRVCRCMPRITLHHHHILTSTVRESDAFTHQLMRDEDFGLVAIFLLFFLSRDRLEADLPHGCVSVCLCLCVSVCAGVFPPPLCSLYPDTSLKLLPSPPRRQ